MSGKLMFKTAGDLTEKPKEVKDFRIDDSAVEDISDSAPVYESEINRMAVDTKRISAVSEIILLVRQYGLILFGNWRSLLLTLVFPFMAMAITVFVAGEEMFNFYENTKSANFVLVSAAIWGGLFNSIQTVVKERANIKRDYVAGALRIESYIISRAFLQFILCMIQSAVLVMSYTAVKAVYDNPVPSNGLYFTKAMSDYYVSLLLLMYSADAMGLLISCIVKKSETASVMAPYILIVQLIFSGILFEMKGFAEKISYLMLSRWGMEALGSISNLNNITTKMQDKMKDQPIDIAHDAEAMFDFTKTHLFHTWQIFLIFIIVFLIGADLFLHMVTKDTRG